MYLDLKANFFHFSINTKTSFISLHSNFIPSFGFTTKKKIFNNSVVNDSVFYFQKEKTKLKIEKPKKYMYWNQLSSNDLTLIVKKSRELIK